MGRLTSEMENMIVDKGLREHPMLDTIWEGVITNKYRNCGCRGCGRCPILFPFAVAVAVAVAVTDRTCDSNSRNIAREL